MVLRRYLVFFSYTGTNFRGVQRQRSRSVEFNEDPSTVQGLIEFVISRLKPKNEVVMNLSSRTDQGVHALKNSCAIDLDFDYDMEPTAIIHFANKFFAKADLDIRIQEMIRVNSDFKVRSNVVWRKYLYKFATLKPNISIGQNISKYLVPIPAPELKRCFYAPVTNFQCERVDEVKDLFIGTKDFITFESRSTSQPVERSTIKELMSLEIKPSAPYLPFTYDNFNFWDITFQGKSFLYKQVRRMVAILIEVGRGNLTYSQVKHMFDNPCDESWPYGVHPAPGEGLYLVEVKYDPASLICTEAEEEQKQAKAEEEQLMKEKEDPALALERRKAIIKARLEELQKVKEEISQQNHVSSA